MMKGGILQTFLLKTNTSTLKLQKSKFRVSLFKVQLWFFSGEQAFTPMRCMYSGYYNNIARYKKPHLLQNFMQYFFLFKILNFPFVYKTNYFSLVWCFELYNSQTKKTVNLRFSLKILHRKKIASGTLIHIIPPFFLYFEYPYFIAFSMVPFLCYGSISSFSML